ncbi:MAG: hypothetical protein EOM24_00955 [Chloroflexia bacterium]|nr:hypothetical protein [Chloroflexia bacterium]
MRRLTLALGGILALFCLAIIYRLAVPSDPSYISPAAYESYLRAQERAEAIEPIKTLASATWWAFVAFLPAGAIWWAISAAVDRRNHRRPDERGLLPVDAEDVPSAALAALAAHHQTEFAKAQRPVYPHTLNYAPRISSQTTGSESTGLAAAPAAISVPSLAELLAAGTVARGEPTAPMILGYADEGPVMGNWLKLYSCGIGGLSGSGKSSTGVFLAAQGVLHGAKLLIIDPHAGDPESLATRLDPLAASFFIDPADGNASISRAIRTALGEVERRMKCNDRSPLVVMVDEFTSLQRSSLADDLSKLVEVLGQEGRKKGVYGLFLGQAWTAARSGGSAARDSLASAFVHRLRSSQARHLTGLRAEELPDDVLDLAPGEAYLLSTSGDMTRVRVPYVSDEAIVNVARLLTADAPTLEVPRQAPGNRVEVVLPAHQEAVNLSDEERRIIERILAGENIPDICRALSGASNGRAYTKAQADIAAALRKALK